MIIVTFWSLMFLMISWNCSLDLFLSMCSCTCKIHTQYLSQLPCILIYMHTFCVYAGPRGVSELRYRSNDSTVVWLPSTTNRSAVDFLYELSFKDGPTLQSSRVTDAELHLPGLEEGKTYILDVWEECDGQWESEHAHVCFEGVNSSLGQLLRAVGSSMDQGQREL